MRHERIVEYTTIAVTPSLEPGERLRLVSRARLGQVSIRSNLFLGMLVTLLTLGTITLYRVPKTVYLALTDRRLLFLEPNDVSGRPTTMVSFAWPISALTGGPVTSGRVSPGFSVTCIELTVPESDGSRSALPLIFHGGCRPDAERLAAAL